MSLTTGGGVQYMGTENKRVLEHHRQHSLRIEGIPDERVAVINR